MKYNVSFNQIHNGEQKIVTINKSKGGLFYMKQFSYCSIKYNVYRGAINWLDVLGF